jgi:hypothetical protein
MDVQASSQKWIHLRLLRIDHTGGFVNSKAETEALSDDDDCLFVTACFARGDKRNDESTFMLLFFRLWRTSKPPAVLMVVDPGEVP